MAKVSEFAQQSFMEDLVRPGNDAEATGLSIGATLRAARQKRGATSIEKVAGEICAWPYHVKAIEKDQFDLLPGTTYAIGFIRAYANFVGLDGAALVQRFKDESAPEPQSPKLEILETLDGPHMPKWAMTATIMVLLAGTYFTWLGLVRESPPPSPPAVSPAFGAEAAPPVTVTPPLALVAQPPMALARNPAAVAEDRPLRHDRQAPVAKDAPAAVKSLPRGQKSVDAARPGQLRSISYIRLYPPAQDARMGAMLAAGDNRQQRGSNPLMIGNRGAFNLLVKNVTSVPDAADGGLRRQVSFDPAAFLSRREPLVP